MLIIDEGSNFADELKAYCKRQLIMPIRAHYDLQGIVENPSNLRALDDQIYGLRVAPLKARQSEHETLLLIDHVNGRQRHVVYVSILSRPLENFLWPCREAVCKRKINLAVARLIMMAKFCGPGPGVVGM